jgi:tRNA threonylcarbamoyladenosine modification (KEOPS) complex  Pcc1 subunit
LKWTVDLAKANNVNLEIILKDISTVRFEPSRLTRWADIAMEIVHM